MKWLNDLFRKFYCLHEWDIHTHITQEHRRIVKGCEHFLYNIPYETVVVNTEILICKKCGKIEKITY